MSTNMIIVLCFLGYLIVAGVTWAIFDHYDPPTDDGNPFDGNLLMGLFWPLLLIIIPLYAIICLPYRLVTYILNKWL
jgi:hypothetical protein